MKKEFDIVREDAPKPSPEDLSCDSYNLYFKGLITWQEPKGLLVGFGVAICRQEDDNNLLFQMKGSLDDSDITGLEAELMALKLGLTKAVSLGINHISIYCDHHEIFELVMGGRPVTEEEKFALHMVDVQRITQQFTSSIPILVTRNQTKFVYKLATEATVSDISRPMPCAAQKKVCGICFDDDIEAEKKMFSVSLCSHQFCVECMKQQIEVRLNEGGLPRCPHFGCTSNLNLKSCSHLLTLKIREMWEQRIKEDSIPVCDRLHCPNPRCWDLMSKTELFESIEDGVRRHCFKCREPFCINCKFPWHSNLSCEEYKLPDPKPTATVWRECRSCQHMIKLSKERFSVTCRCGYTFATHVKPNGSLEVARIIANL